ncbi:MAG: pyrroline-5-carboxylate reductase [Syntrophomonadaceae bacterium]|jgi:pyrroline-5-carboxylate reductase
MSQNLGIIGCGKMANAIVKGLTTDKAGFADILVYDIDEEKLNKFSQLYGAKSTSLLEIVQVCNIIILAVKPHQVKEVLEAARDFWHEGQMLISIAAGIKIATLEKITEDKIPVVRVMPNTPCLVGEGMAAVAAGSKAAEREVNMVIGLFNRLGKAIKIDEKYMDAVTAVSGSGPAYVFLVVEAFVNAAINIGLDAVIARELVSKTMLGSLQMLEKSGDHPAILRQDVSSPGGTTIAGIRKLEDNGLRKAFFDAVEMAYLRSIELSQE